MFSGDVVTAASASPDLLRSFEGPQEVQIRGRAKQLAIWLGTLDRSEQVEDVINVNVGR